MVPYTELGWKLAFARHREKNPGSLMGKGWQQKLASTPEDVDFWLKKAPDANVGVFLGPDSGVIDVEYDTEEGEEIVERIISSDDCPTPTYRSGKSIHRLYRWDATLPEETCPTYKGIEFRLNSKGRSIQSILPPSIHPSGKKYEWLPGLSPEEVPVNGMPFELWDLCWYAATRRSNSDQTSVDENGDLYVEHGSRHDWLRDRIWSMSHWGLSEGQLTQVAHVLDLEVAHFEAHDREKKIKEFVQGALDKRTLKEDIPSSEIDFGFVDSTTFDKMSFASKWIIPGILKVEQPCIVCGPSKAMKTTCAVEVAVSVASGMDLWNKYPTEQHNVALMSAESGAETLQETARRISVSKGLTLSGLSSSLFWAFRAPNITANDHLASLRGFIEEHNIKVLVVDPLYMAMGNIGDRVNNQFGVGHDLSGLAELVAQTKVTPMICGHTPKNTPVGIELDLQYIAHAGFGQWFRQWFLVNRRTAFDSSLPGKHELFINYGGSAGHSGAWAVDIDEGLIESGRHWEYRIRSTGEFRAEKKESREIAKAAQSAETRDQFLRVLESGDEMTAGALAKKLGRARNGVGFINALEDLVGTGLVVEQIQPWGNRQRASYRLAAKDSDS